MKGTQLARTLAELCSRRPEYDDELFPVLIKWIRDKIGKPTTLDSFRSAATNGRGDLVALFVDAMSSEEIRKVAKKLDPYRSTLAQDPADALRAHVQLLVRRECQPAERATTRRVMPIEDILAIKDPIARRAELQRHTPAQLKIAIREKQIDSAQVSSRPTKTELIEHIQAALAAGWPKIRSILD